MFKIIFNTLLGAVLIFIWLQFVNIEEIRKSLSAVKPSSLLPIFIFMCLAIAFRSYRLQIILSKVKKIDLTKLFFLNGAAALINFLIPIRGGEIAKSFYLSQNYDLPIGKTLIWIFLDRFCDFLVVFIVGAGLLMLVPTHLGGSIVNIVIIGAILLLLISYLLVFQTKIARILYNFFRQFLIFNNIKTYFDKVFEFFIDAFSIFKTSPLKLLTIFLVSVLGYAAEAFIWYFSFLALGVNQDYLKMYLGQLLSALTYLIPAAPGYVGSAEASGLLVFTGVFGIDPNLASSMTVLFHVCTAIFIVIFGVIAIYRLDLNIGLIIKKVFNKES